MFGEEAIQLKAETSGWIIFRYEKKFEMQKKNEGKLQMAEQNNKHSYIMITTNLYVWTLEMRIMKSERKTKS